MKAGTQTGICLSMFIVVLFTVAKTGKQFKCPLTDEYINKMQYVHAMEYYSAAKCSKSLIHTTTWRNLENMLMNKPDTKGQTLHNFSCMRYLHTWNSQIPRERKK